MKKLYKNLFICLISFGSITLVLAQKQPQLIHFAKGDFISTNNFAKGSFTKEDIKTSLWEDKFFVLMQFAKNPGAAEKEQLENKGFILKNYLPNNAYLSIVNADADFSALKNFAVNSIQSIPAFYKIDASVDNYIAGTDKSINNLFAVSYFTNFSTQKVIGALQQLGAKIVITKFNTANTIFIQPNASIVYSIAALPFVNYIKVQNLTASALNYDDISTQAISGIQTNLGTNLRGQNVTLGVGDNSDINTHIDFSNRVINRCATTPANHGTHTSGTVAGAGNIMYVHKGVAPKATILSSYFTDILTQTPTFITDNNLVATNNSYTTASNGCAGDGVYDVTSNYLDDQMHNYPTVLHVFAAGNDGGNTCSSFPTSYATIKSGFQCAKNVLTVGGIDPSNYLIGGFSSRGPVSDGRIKPEIVTDGAYKISTFPNNSYNGAQGTSMAAPVATGASGLLVERYRQLNANANPKSALVKALLCNTAEDLGNPGPDFTYGFGMLNARRAIEAMEANQYFINNTNASYAINVPVNVRRLKVMLYWADAAATAGSAPALVNDLDLTVTGASGSHLPLILNPAPTNVNDVAVEGADHINNIEQVVIDNPTAGIHNLNVNLFNVPQGPQEYVLTYQIDNNGVTLEYPYGGETLVPGENETIRWTANGDETSTYTVDYTLDNGTNWVNINTNVAATAKSINWTVPAAATSLAKIRVTKNLSGYTSQSQYNFTILDVPTITASVPCPGYVQLNWAAVANATDYDIFKLNGDSMQIIANTAGNSYLVQGLTATTSYWFGVRANDGNIKGRRSISVNATPSTGTCTLPDFNNNFAAVSLDAPQTGRQFTSTALSSSELIKITIKNLSSTTSSGTYNLYYQINGNPIVTENSSVAIPSLSTLQYTFSTTADFSAAGIYNIKAWVKNTGDLQPLDDTIFCIIKNLSNPILTLPITDGFETTTIQEYTTNTLGLEGDDKLDFKTNSTRGRARTFVNTGFALNGNRAITLDQTPNGNLVTDSLLITYNASNYNAGNQLRLDFYYKNQGQVANPDNKTWIRGSDNQPWVLAYDLATNQAALGQWKHAIINVNDVLPTQPITSSFQVKLGQQGNNSANLANPIVDEDDGYTFDDITLAEAINDIALNAVLWPSSSGCGIAGAQSLQISIKNYSSTNFINVPVSYRINGGSIITEIIPSVNANALLNYTFATPANFANNTDYVVDFWVKEPTDNYPQNDSLLSYNFHTSDIINTFPYLENFENSNGNFYAKGFNNSWQWGAPTKTIINKAASGSKAWVTNLTGNYNDNETSYLYSPCFDLSTLSSPMLSFSHIHKTEFNFDYTWVEYSVDGGITWLKLGTQAQGTNWYNDAQNVWNTANTKWHVSSCDIPTTATSVRFRFVLSSDGGTNDEGVGIDDIHIFDKISIYTGANTAATPVAISGNNWIDLNEAGGKRIASINPQGNDLGTTTGNVYFNTAAVRFTAAPNNQYYLDRNIVITPTTQPTSPVLVRFYFTDAEALALMNATGCGICTTIYDPYVAGITKYSGANENGDFADDIDDNKIFILPASTNKIPYEKGYYAEFAVSSFSEFWINNGGLTGTTPLPLQLILFDANKQNNYVNIVWQTSNEINADKFIIEHSADGNLYSPMGAVMAKNSGGVNAYNFKDEQPTVGLNYYRLKIMDKDGNYKYSPIRLINFAEKDGITIYPNPVKEGNVYVVASQNCNKAILYDAAGKWIKTYLLNGPKNNLILPQLSKGLYQLKVFTTNNSYVQKIIIQ